MQVHHALVLELFILFYSLNNNDDEGDRPEGGHEEEKEKNDFPPGNPGLILILPACFLQFFRGYVSPRFGYAADLFKFAEYVRLIIFQIIPQFRRKFDGEPSFALKAEAPGEGSALEGDSLAGASEVSFF